MHMVINGVTTLLTVLYPLAVYFGVNYFEPWKIAGMLMVWLLIKRATRFVLK